MAGKFFILQSVADFAPGFFENTAVEDGCVHLLAQGEGYAESGAYTSPPFHSEAFFSLVPSWNADVPPGTDVEMQVRLATDGRWSRWFSFGCWSPYARVAVPPLQEDKIAATNGETLSLREGAAAADVLQMRVFLTTENPALTPQVRMLALSTNAAQQMGHDEPKAHARRLELPAYSCLTRDPALAPRIAGPTTLTMLMNRWGRDLLPEEVARCAWDSAADNYGNLALLCAAAGCQGFSCHAAYAGLSALRREVWLGRAVAARVRLRPAGAQDAAETQSSQTPPAPGAPGSGHLVAVHGFQRRDDGEYVLLHDPLSPSDNAVRREVSLSAFARMYTGMALFLSHGARRAGWAAPARRLARLGLRDGQLSLTCGNEDIIPGLLGAAELQPATLCYSLANGVAYAASAQRAFHYLKAENGAVPFDASLAAGHRLNVYYIAAKGRVWVAEKQPEPPRDADLEAVNNGETP